MPTNKQNKYKLQDIAAQLGADRAEVIAMLDGAFAGTTHKAQSNISSDEVGYLLEVFTRKHEVEDLMKTFSQTREIKTDRAAVDKGKPAAKKKSSPKKEQETKTQPQTKESAKKSEKPEKEAELAAPLAKNEAVMKKETAETVPPQQDSKSEIIPETKPEPVSEAKPEPKPEVKAEPKQESIPEPEVKADSKQETATENKAMNNAENTPKSDDRPVQDTAAKENRDAQREPKQGKGQQDKRGDRQEKRGDRAENRSENRSERRDGKDGGKIRAEQQRRSEQRQRDGKEARDARDARDGGNDRDSRGAKSRQGQQQSKPQTPKPSPSVPAIDSSKIKVNTPPGSKKAKGEQVKRGEQVTKTVDTRGSYVELDKYNERYESMAGKMNSDSYRSKQKFQPKQQSKGKFGGKRETEAQKLKRLELERARKQQLKVQIPDEITVGELATRLKTAAPEVIKKLFNLGVMASINETIDFDTAALVADELGAKVEKEIVVTIE